MASEVQTRYAVLIAQVQGFIASTEDDLDDFAYRVKNMVEQRNMELAHKVDLDRIQEHLEASWGHFDACEALEEATAAFCNELRETLFQEARGEWKGSSFDRFGPKIREMIRVLVDDKMKPDMINETNCE